MSKAPKGKSSSGGVSKSSSSSASISSSDFLKREEPLQAVLFADSFEVKFPPITLERPKVLLPLVNLPLLEYSIEFLVSGGVREIFIFCCAHFAQINDYLNNSKWLRSPNSPFVIKPINSSNCFSPGDALRHLDSLDLIKGDFVLISGDVISNIKLEEVVKAHKQRVSADKSNIMTVVMKAASIGHRTRTLEDDTIVGVDESTGQLVHYENSLATATVSCDRELFEEHPSLTFRKDLMDSFIDICSPQVLMLFTDNFDWQDVRKDFIRGILGDNVYGNKIHIHVCEEGEYAARLRDFKTYDSISKDILHRWTYPMVPDTNLLQNRDQKTDYRFSRGNIYKESGIQLDRDARIGEDTVIGHGSSIGKGTAISASVIGRNCRIGKNCQLKNCYLWGDNTIEDGVKMECAIVCNGVTVGKGAVLEKGAVLGFSVRIGEGFVVKSNEKLTTVKTSETMESGEVRVEYVSAADSDAREVGKGGVGRRFIAEADGPDNEDDDGEKLAMLEKLNSMAPDWSVIAALRKKQLEEEDAECQSEEDEEELEADGTINEEDEDAASDQDETDAKSPSAASPTPSTTAAGGTIIHHSASYDNFLKEVGETLLRGHNENLTVDDILLEVGSLKFSHDASIFEYFVAVLLALLKIVEREMRKTQPNADSISLFQSPASKPLLNSLGAIFKRWQLAFKKYSPKFPDQMALIDSLEYVCTEVQHQLYISLFSVLMQFFHVNFEILPEDAVLKWEEKSIAAGTETKKKLLKQIESLLEWIKQEDEEEEDEDDGEEEDD